MKKIVPKQLLNCLYIIAFFIIISTLVLFTACRDKQENKSEETEDNSISVSSIEKQDEAVNS